MGLTVTMLVARFLLGGFTMDGTARLSVLLLHDVAPLMASLDWLLFDERGRVGRPDPLMWTAFPLAHLAYALIAACAGDDIGFGVGRYPCPFLNMDALGAGRVALTCAALPASFILPAAPPGHWTGRWPAAPRAGKRFPHAHGVTR